MQSFGRRSACLRQELRRGAAVVVAALFLFPLLSLAAGTNVVQRTTVVVLDFENKTDAGESNCWQFAFPHLLQAQLDECKSLRVIRTGVRFALRETKVELPNHKAPQLTTNDAARIGALLEVQHVIWGDYQQRSGIVVVKARIFDVASGEFSEFTAKAPDWFVVRDRIGNAIVSRLKLTLSDLEERRMMRRWTDSSEALQQWAQAVQNRETGLSARKSLKPLRRAVEIDNNFAEAHAILGSILNSVGQTAEGIVEARRAVRLLPSSADVHTRLASLLSGANKNWEAEEELKTALRLDPENANTWHSLGELRSERNPESAIAAWKESVRLENASSEVHAHLATAYVAKGDRAQALEELKLAEHFNTGDDHGESLIGSAYGMLQDFPAAIEHLQKGLAWAQQREMKVYVDEVQQLIRQAKQRLEPHYIDVPEPKNYSSEMLARELGKRLSRREAKQIINPFAASAAITNWAKQIVADETDGWKKARRIFEVLSAHPHRTGGGARTAQEVFAKWTNTDIAVSCQEYTKLYIAMARAVGLNAYYVHLERDYATNIVYHDCAAVYVGGKGALVDAAYQWFGPPHREFLVLDDVQAVAHHYFQQNGKPAEWVANCRMADKLHPDFAWGKMSLAAALISADQFREARKALDAGDKLEPGRWDSFHLRGVLAAKTNDKARAIELLRSAVALNPNNGEVRLNLAQTLKQSGKLSEARKEFRAALKSDLLPEAERQNALDHLADIERLLKRRPGSERLL